MKLIKKNFMGLLSLGCALAFSTNCMAQQNVATEKECEWILDFEDNFDGPELDTRVWSRVPRGKSDWNDTQAPDDERCFEFRNGTLVLKGIVNDNVTEEDPALYHTGGIWSYDKKAFAPGKFEICVRMKACKGSWPAIWLMPYEHKKYQWPEGGEIDIMETLSYDDFAYQTIHTKYTKKHKQTEYPKYYDTSAIRVNDWNVFGVEILEDKLVFTINGKPTHVYPKVETEYDGQFPFYVPQELRIDQQLGGEWVGEVDPAGLPIEMEVDWVRHYVKK